MFNLLIFFSAISFKETVPANSTIFYQAEILDIVPESEKSYLEDFLHADLNGDFLVDVKEVRGGAFFRPQLSLIFTTFFVYFFIFFLNRLIIIPIPINVQKKFPGELVHISV